MGRAGTVATLAVALAAPLGLMAAGAARPALAGSREINLKLETLQREIAEGRDRETALGSKAASIAREMEALRASLVTTARAIQTHEARLTAIELRLVALDAEEAEKADALARRRETLGAMLGALERLGRRPPEAMIASPASPSETIRASLLLASAVPTIDAQARALRGELASLGELRRRIALERTRIETTSAELAAEKKRIARLLARKTRLQDRTRAERRAEEKRVARLASKANSLRDLLEKLSTAALAPPPPPPAADKPAPPEPERAAPGAPPSPDDPLALGGATSSFTAARGTLPLPVQGRLVRLFGERRSDGTFDKGLTIETRPGAQVVTPYDGRVVFAGPFRGYGQLLILEHGEGYHMLLAGFARIDTRLGQWLLAGEPVGVMGPGGHGKPALYVELRRNGEAINLLPWLATSTGKVSG